MECLSTIPLERPIPPCPSKTSGKFIAQINKLSIKIKSPQHFLLFTFFPRATSSSSSSLEVDEINHQLRDCALNGGTNTAVGIVVDNLVVRWPPLRDLSSLGHFPISPKKNRIRQQWQSQISVSLSFELFLSPSIVIFLRGIGHRDFVEIIHSIPPLVLSTKNLLENKTYASMDGIGFIFCLDFFSVFVCLPSELT